MNARLLVKTLHRPALLRARPASPLPRAGAHVRLLGDGTDALLLRAAPHVEQPTPETRLLRYLRARHIHRDGQDPRLDSLRVTLGTAFQMAWRDGRRPDLRLTRPMTLSPVGLP